jgi:hypothetical protein
LPITTARPEVCDTYPPGVRGCRALADASPESGRGTSPSRRPWQVRRATVSGVYGVLMLLGAAAAHQLPRWRRRAAPATGSPSRPGARGRAGGRGRACRRSPRRRRCGRRRTEAVDLVDMLRHPAVVLQAGDDRMASVCDIALLRVLPGNTALGPETGLSGPNHLKSPATHGDLRKMNQPSRDSLYLQPGPNCSSGKIASHARGRWFEPSRAHKRPANRRFLTSAQPLFALRTRQTSPPE